MAIDFPGTTNNGYHYTGTTSLLQGAAGITILASKNADTTGSSQSIISNYHGSGAMHFLFRTNNTQVNLFLGMASGIQSGSATIGPSQNNDGSLAAAWDQTSTNANVYSGATKSSTLFTNSGTLYSAGAATNEYNIGVSPHSTSQVFNGELWEIAVFGVRLTDEQIFAYTVDNVSPALLQRDGLAFYAPLVRDGQDVMRQDNPTGVGSLLVQPHRPFLYQNRPHAVTAPAAAVGGGGTPIHYYRRMAGMAG